MASTDTATELHAQLEESLRNLVTSQDWLHAIEVASRFHDYSFANTQLIWLQATGRGFTPTRVAGYRMWQQLGRQVRSGEHGIQILAPVTRRLPTTGNPGDLGTEAGGERDERRRVVGFRVVHVFDITQTDGEPLPDIRPELVTGDLPQQWGNLTALIAAEGFTLSTADPGQLGSANGMTSWGDQRVLLRHGLSGAQRFKTAAHELAHIRLHNPHGGTRPVCRGVIEVEAESVAYIVAAAAGIDTASYSLPYVATWSGGDPSIVAATAQRVVTCAQDILPGLQPRELDHTTTPAGVDAPAKQRDARETIDADRATPRHPGSSTGEADPAMYTIHPPGHGAILTQNGGCATCAADATHLVIHDGPGRPGKHGDAYYELACTAHAERARRGGAMTYPRSVIPRHTLPPRPVPSPDIGHVARLEEALQRAIDHYRTSLDSPEGEPGRRHLNQRHITPQITDRFQLGYTPPQWDTLTTVLRREGFTDQELIDAGITGKARTGRLYDRMRGRLVFPLHDHNSRPVGLAGRLLTGNGPKYLNSPQTDLYHKGELLYGLHLARPHITSAGRAIVVEGYLDAIAAHQAGITNTVAIAGTTLTPHHLARLRSTTRNITLALDGDTPGQAATARIADPADTADLDLDIRVATLPPGRDPADLVADGESELLDKALHDAVPLPIHLIDRTLNRHNLIEIEDKVRALRAAAAIIIGITDPETRAAAADHLARRLDWEPATAEAQLARYADISPDVAGVRHGTVARRRSMGLSR